MKNSAQTSRKARALHDQAAAAAGRRLAQIRVGLCPDVPGEAPVLDFARGLGRQLETADTAARNDLMLRAAMAIADIRDLVNSLDAQLRQTREELQRLNGHSRAALAYAGAVGTAKMGRPR
ncbi:hypothetical protein [Radicibacter daui]|uniref:hypothetical protein n=1 Tax=Radicibacter daui TaxID=3064829 RepID=UPI004046A252